MAQFLNQEVDPKAKASGKSAQEGTNETKVAWDNATDQGVSAPERTVNQAKAMEPAVSAGVSFIAGAQNSIIAAAVRKASAPDFQDDPEFDAKMVMPNDPSMKLYKPNSEEIEWLHGSKSTEEYQYRTQEMLAQRERAQQMSENTLSGIAGAIVGDSPLIVAPMGAWGIAGRVGLAVRTGIRAADVGSAVYAADQPGQSNTVAGIVAAVSGLDQLWDMARVGRAVRSASAVDRHVEQTVAQASKVDDLTVAPKFDPAAPTKRTAPDSEVRRYSTGQDSIDNNAPVTSPVIAPAVEPVVEPARQLPDGVVLNVLDDVEHHSKAGVRVPGMEVEVTRDGQLVGIVQAYKTGDDLQVSHAWVDDSLRGQGVGQAMYAQLRAKAKTAGYSNLVSDSSVTVSAQRMWDKMGAVRSQGAKELDDGIEGQRYSVSFDEQSPLYSLDLKAEQVKPAIPKLSEAFYSTKLKAPIKVAAGEQASVRVSADALISHLAHSAHLDDAQKLLLKTLHGVVKDTPVSLTANTRQRSAFAFKPGGNAADDYIVMRAAKSQDGKVWNTAGDALNALDSDTSKIAVHELIHAATTRALRSTDPVAVQANADLIQTVKQIQRRGDVPDKLKYYASNVDEALAGLGNSREWVDYLASVKLGENKTLLQQIGSAIMKALGFSGNETALARVVSGYERLLQSASKEGDKELFASSSLSKLESTLGESVGTARAEKMLTGVRDTLKQSFSLYDNIAAGSKELADLLVSDGAAVGARKPAVADFKRNLTLEMDGAASVVEDAVLAQLRKNGVGLLDRFFHRSRFKEQRTALEDKFAKYLDIAYDAETNGRTIPVPSDDIAPLVQAYRESGWSSRWHDHMTASGLIEDGSFPKSEFYFPRQYSYDKMRQGILDMKAQGMDEARALETYRGLFRAALRDVAPEIDSAVANRVATEMLNGIYHGRANQPGAAWRSLVPGISNDELVDKLYRAGMDEEAVQKFVRGNIAPDRGSSPVKNVRARTRFNMTKEFVVNGQSMRMQDLMDTDVAKVMHGYTNRMSGRVGLAYAGIKDLRNLAKLVDESKHALPDSQRWGKTVDDTIDYMLGGVVGTQMPELFRAAGNLANATMLKNSGLYQITDTALAMKEFGMTRVLRSMVQQPWFKEGTVVLKDKGLSTRLDSILRGSIQKDMRFRWLNTYADDNLDLTRSSNWFNVTQNLGQAARHVNGMSMVHRAQVNLNAGIVMDEITEMLKGSSDAFTRLEKYGLSADVAEEARTAYRANPDAMLPPATQMQVEVVGARMMDYLVQQVRTGETSYFAQLNPVGRVIVGYQSFAMAATNKILRRTLNDTGPLGLAHLMAYQFPLMLLATQAKHTMDGKDAKTPQDLIAEAVLGMSAIGGISLIQPLFTGMTPRHSLAAMGYVASSLGALQDIAAGKADAQSLSRVLPLVQEFMPLRAVINNYGEE